MSSGPVNLSSSTFVSGVLPIINGGTNNNSFNNGGIVYFDGTRLTDKSAQFFFDASNNRLGIGTSNPQYTLDVSGNSYVSGFLGVGQSLSVTGNAGIGQSLNVTSIGTFGGLNVSGLSALNNVNATNINAATLTTTGNVGVGASLSVTSIGVLGGLNVSGLSSLGNVDANNIRSTTLTTTGNVGVGGSLSVTSGANFDSSVNVSGNTQLTTLSTSGNTGVGGSLTVTSAATISTLGTGLVFSSANGGLSSGPLVLSSGSSY